MPAYRCYFLTADTRIVKVETNDLPHDTDAIAWARGLVMQHPQYPTFEVWQQGRLVHRQTQGK